MIVVGGVEVCKWGGGVWEECGGRDGEVWLEGWRSVVGEVEDCGVMGKVWWEGWRSMVGGVEVCWNE